MESQGHRDAYPHLFCDFPIFFKLYFLIMLLQLSQFYPFAPSTKRPPLPQAFPTQLFMSMGHGYKFFGYSISYTVLYIPTAIL